MQTPAFSLFSVCVTFPSTRWWEYHTYLGLVTSQFYMLIKLAVFNLNIHKHALIKEQKLSELSTVLKNVNVVINKYVHENVLFLSVALVLFPRGRTVRD